MPMARRVLFIRRMPNSPGCSILSSRCSRSRFRALHLPSGDGHSRSLNVLAQDADLGHAETEEHQRQQGRHCRRVTELEVLERQHVHIGH